MFEIKDGYDIKELNEWSKQRQIELIEKGYIVKAVKIKHILDKVIEAEEPIGRAEIGREKKYKYKYAIEIIYEIPYTKLRGER